MTLGRTATGTRLMCEHNQAQPVQGMRRFEDLPPSALSPPEKRCGAKSTHFTEEATLFDVVTRSHLCSRVLPVSTGLPAGLRLFRHRTQAIVVVVCRQGWTSCRTHMRSPLLLNTAHIRLLLSLQPLSPQTMGLDDLCFESTYGVDRASLCSRTSSAAER